MIRKSLLLSISCLLSFAAWSNASPPANQLSYYPFDSDASDTVGSNDGTLNSGASIISDGTRGYVLNLDGTNDYVSLPTGSLTTGRSEVTVAFWIRTDDWTSTDALWDEHYNWYWQFAISQGTWYTRDSSTGSTGSRNNDLSLPTLSNGSWHHLAFVYSVSDGSKKIYLDGDLYATSTTSVDALTSDRDQVNLGSPSDGTYFDGRLDDVRVYTRALSESEIEYLAEIEYTLTVNSGSGDGDYTQDTEVNISADSPSTGYQFSAWTGDTASVANVNNASTTVTMPADDVTVTATYSQINYTLTVNNGSGDGSTYHYNDVVNITADSPAQGYAFDEWTGDTAYVANVNNASTTVTMPAGNVTVTATYVATGYTLTVNSGSGDGTYAPTTVVNISADTAPTGQFFDKWTGDVQYVTDVNDPTTTFTMPASNASVTANYTDVASGLVSRYTFDIDARDSIGSNNGTFTNGAGITTDATRGSVATLDGTDDYINLPSASMTAGRAEVTVSLWVRPTTWNSGDTIWDEYSGAYWQFTLQNGGWYTRDASTGTTGSRNNDLTVPSLSTSTWHHIALVYSDSGDYKRLYVDGALSTSSTTSIDTLTSARDGARIGYPADGSYFEGRIDDVRLYNRALNATEVAYLAEKPLYTLTVNNGTGDGSYVEDQVVNISADAPAQGYTFSAWTGDTAYVASTTSANTTVTMPAGNVSVTATYTQTSTYTLTVNSGSGDGSYAQSTQVNISADSPASGYEFDDWEGDTAYVDDVDDPTTFVTMPASNVTVTATYTYVGGGSNPSISSTSGTWSSGNSVTISGTNFGTKSSAAPLVWDDFESGSNGSSIDGEAPVIGPDWGSIASSGTPPKYSNYNNRANSSLCSKHDFTVSGQYNCSLSYVNATSVAYFTFWWKYDLSGSTYNRNTKPWVVYGSSGNDTPDAYAGFGNPDYNDGSLRNALQDYPNQPTNQTLYGGPDISSINHEWIRFEVYVIQSTPNTADGTYMLWVQRPYASSPPAVDLSLEGDGDRMTRTTSNYWRQWTFGSYFARDVDPYGGGGPVDGNTYIDDFYFDTTQARVEVGDASTWASCTQREIQIPSAWSGSSVTITVNRGGFSSLSGKYLYVVDAAGNVNSNGYQIP